MTLGLSCRAYNEPMIYYVEDDSNIRDLALIALSAQGLEGRGFESAREFREACSAAQPDLVLLDIMLPEEDGLSILSWIRNSSEMRDVPVMMLTAKGAEYDKVHGLDLGADDYLAKPFGPMPALLARAEHITKVHAICVRCGQPAQHSHRLPTVKGAGADEQVLLGEMDKYEPLCRHCFNAALKEEGKL